MIPLAKLIKIGSVLIELFRNNRKVKLFRMTV